MPKVYVAGALIPTGGAYMAYHIGRLLHLHFGYELVDVGVHEVNKRIFVYDTPIRTVSPEAMEKSVSAEDLLVVNPAFSKFLYGLRLPGRKIMYAQDFRTFSILDCHMDLVVSVSSVVRNFLSGVYDIGSEVIPAFIQLKRLPAAKPWRERPENSVLVYMKHPTVEHQAVLKFLSHQLKKIDGSIDLSKVLEGRHLSHTEFMEAIGSVRYFLNLSLAEGFGLVPLEAMAMGTTVIGCDGLAGRDYMRSGENCLIGSVRNVKAIPALMHTAFSDPILAERCAAAGKETANRYGYPAFKAAWLKQLSAFLQTQPSHD